MLVIDKPPFKNLEAVKATNMALGVDFEVLSPEELHKRYPGILNIPRDHKAILETNAGLIKADKALECLRVRYASIFWIFQLTTISFHDHLHFI